MMEKKNFNYMLVFEPILLHLLEGEMENPEAFLTACKNSIGQFVDKGKDKFPQDLLMFIGMPFWIYINLKEKLGQEKAFEITKICMLAGGVTIQSILFDSVHYPRDFKTFIERELLINQSGSTKWNVLEVKEKSDCRFELVVTKCMYHELTTHMGIPEATPVICQVDNALFNSYLPEEMIFQRGGLNRRIADGSNDGCHFIFERIPK